MRRKAQTPATSSSAVATGQRRRNRVVSAVRASTLSSEFRCKVRVYHSEGISVSVLHKYLRRASFGRASTGRAQTDGVRVLTLTSNDIIYDPFTQKIYASVPSSAGGIRT